MDEVSGTSAVIDRLEMDSVYVLRVRGCNKAGYGEYSEEVYLHTPPAPGESTRRTFQSLTSKQRGFDFATGELHPTVGFGTDITKSQSRSLGK